MRLNKLAGAIALACGVLLAQSPQAMAIPSIEFTEEMDGSLHHVTDQVHSSDRGVANSEFTVDKFIHNISGKAWTDFHIDLLALINGVFEPSPHSDGVSFDEAYMTDAEWAAAVTVDINGVDKGANGGTWRAERSPAPVDSVDFFFDGFKVNPGDTLSLHFTMSDNDNNTWKLAQHATVPEPGTLLLLAGGLFGLAALRRKQHWV